MAKGSGGTRSGSSRNPNGVGARVTYGSDWSSKDGTGRREMSMRGESGYMAKVFMKEDGGSYKVYATDFGNGFSLKGTTKTFASEQEAKDYAEGLMTRMKAGEFKVKETKAQSTNATKTQTTTASATQKPAVQPSSKATSRTLFQSTVSKMSNVEDVTYNKNSNTIEVFLGTRKAYGDSYTRTLRASANGSVTLENSRWNGNVMRNDWDKSRNTPGMRQEEGYGVLKSYMDMYKGKKNAPSIIITQYYD